MEKKYLVEESYLTSIADIIRNKTGLTNKLTFPDEFFEEIRNIETSPATALPVLDMNYPEDVTVMEGTNLNASFSVIISEPGIPAIYTYQWYENGNPIEGATNAIYNKTTNFTVGNYSVYCEITNEAGSVTSRIATLTVQSSKPIYTYSGNASFIQDSTYNWRIKFLTSGVLNFSYLGNAESIDVFCVGGGGGGGGGGALGGTGGGGGYTKTSKKVSVEKNKDYTITVGSGGGINTNGGSSSAFNLTANGGSGNHGTYGRTPCDGGSGGGGANGGYGGSDGSDGKVSSADPDRPVGKGQGSTTREFGETGNTLYAGGGGSACGNNVVTGKGGSGGGGNGVGNNGSKLIASTPGTTNTGGGGGGGNNSNYQGAAGGSGIVVIRNHRS